MSPYDYGGLRFICEELAKLDIENIKFKRHMLMIDILMSYIRCNPPGETECQIDPDVDVGLVPFKTSWHSSWSHHLKYSLKRLPFHQLVKDPIVILSPEITDQSLPRLLPLSQVMSLSPDFFYESIVQKKVVILKSVKCHAVDDSSPLKIIRFAEFKPWLSKIKDYELALRTTVFVAGNFPRGEDRISAYQLALLFAERWQKSLKDDDDPKLLEMAATGCTKIRSLHGVSVTEFSLQANGLQDLDHLVTDSSSLLTELLTLNAKFNVSPDVIHEIVSGLAERNGVDLDKFKLMLMQRWLTSKSTELSEFVITDRILFLLFKKVDWGMKHLQGFSNLPSTKITLIARTRAISAMVRLMLLPDCSVIVDRCKLQNRLKSVLYQSEFTSKSISQPIKDFDGCDKHALARSLWISERDNIQGLRLICLLCLDFELWDEVLLPNTIKQLIQKKDFNFLVAFIGDLLQNLLFSDSELFCLLGRTVAMETIREWTLNEEIISLTAFISSIRLSTILALPEVVEKVKGILLEGMTNTPPLDPKSLFMYLFGLSSVKESLEELENILMTFQPNMLLHLVEFLINDDACNQFRENFVPIVFTVLDKLGSYSIMSQSKYFDAFIHHLVKTSKINSLLLASLDEGKFAEAVKLVKFYCKSKGITENFRSAVEGYVASNAISHPQMEKLMDALESN